MRFGELLGHGELLGRLWRAAAGGRLPHALLLEGDAGIGKFLAARCFAAGLLCRNGPERPCGECGPCKRVASGGHADLFVIDAEAEGEERIKLGRIALRGDEGASPEGALESFLSLRPLEGERRVVLVREAHRMNDAAQNAFLKTLEEPRPGNVLVLETHLPARLLRTILSRCVRVRFEPLSADECARVLAGAGLDLEEASRLARWASGSPGAALAWHARGVAPMRDALAAVLAGRVSPLVASARIWELEGRFAGKRPTAQARDRARHVLDLALALVRDGQRLAAGVPAEELPHGDLAPVGGGGGTLVLGRVLDELLTCRADVDRNLAPEGIVDRAMLALAEAGSRPSEAGRR